MAEGIKVSVEPEYKVTVIGKGGIKFNGWFTLGTIALLGTLAFIVIFDS